MQSKANFDFQTWNKGYDILMFYYIKILMWLCCYGILMI